MSYYDDAKPWMPITKVDVAQTPQGRVFSMSSAKYDYMEVDTDSVAIHERRAADAALDIGTEELELGPTHIHWFRPHVGDAPVAFRAGGAGDYIGGRTRTGRTRCIWICAGQEPAAIATAVLHELRHNRFSRDAKHLPGHALTPEERAETEGLADAYVASHAATIEAIGETGTPPPAPRRAAGAA